MDFDNIDPVTILTLMTISDFHYNHNFFQTGLEKDSGKTCWLELKKFVDICGTFKISSSIGYEEFANATGIYQLYL